MPTYWIVISPKGKIIGGLLPSEESAKKIAERHGEGFTVQKAKA